MFCDQCGAELNENSKFCPACGAPMAGRAAVTPEAEVEVDATLVMPAEPAEAESWEDEVDATQPFEASVTPGPVAPQPVAPAAAAEPPAPSSRKPTLPVIAAVAALALVVVFGLGMMLGKSSGSGGTTDAPKAQTDTSGTDDKTDDTTDTSSQDGGSSAGQQDAGGADGTDAKADNPSVSDKISSGTAGTSGSGDTGSTSSGGSTSSTVSEKTLTDWSNKAHQFMNYYPANHLLAGGANDAPSPMDVDIWASTCLRYVDPSSQLGQDLQNDPEGTARDACFFDAAQVVRGTEVDHASADGVIVVVTLESTQMSRSDTVTYQRSYLVRFNSGNMVTDVQLLG